MSIGKKYYWDSELALFQDIRLYDKCNIFLNIL